MGNFGPLNWVPFEGNANMNPESVLVVKLWHVILCNSVDGHLVELVAWKSSHWGLCQPGWCTELPAALWNSDTFRPLGKNACKVKIPNIITGWWFQILSNTLATLVCCHSRKCLENGFKYFYFHPYLGKSSNLTNAHIFQLGWVKKPPTR